MEITPEVQELIDSKVDEIRQSFEEEKDKIAQNSRRLLDEKKNLERKLSNFEGIDLDEIKQIKQALKDKEEEDLLKGGKIDELVEKRVQSTRLDYENKLTEKDNTLSEFESKYNQLASTFDQYRIREALITEARKQNALDSAIEDIVLRANGVFSFGEDGSIAAYDETGHIKTVDGKALNPENFVKILKKNAPHLWPQSSGAGLRGSGDGDTYGKGSSLDEAAKTGDMAAFRKMRRQQKKV